MLKDCEVLKQTRIPLSVCPNQEGLGACPPEKFENLDPLRLNVRSLLLFKKPNTNDDET